MDTIDAMAQELHIQLFAGLVDAAGSNRIVVPRVDGETVGALRTRIAIAFPALKPQIDAIAIAINEAYAHADDVIGDGDRIALIPPVSGG